MGRLLNRPYRNYSLFISEAASLFNIHSSPRITPFATSGNIVQTATFFGRPGRGVPTGAYLRSYIYLNTTLTKESNIFCSYILYKCDFFMGDRSEPQLAIPVKTNILWKIIVYLKKQTIHYQ